MLCSPIRCGPGELGPSPLSDLSYNVAFHAKLRCLYSLTPLPTADLPCHSVHLFLM